MDTYIFVGVCDIQFKLSYNSSVLNVWTVTPLVYAGLREAHVLPESSSNVNIGELLLYLVFVDDKFSV